MNPNKNLNQEASWGASVLIHASIVFFVYTAIIISQIKFNTQKSPIYVQVPVSTQTLLNIKESPLTPPKVQEAQRKVFGASRKSVQSQSKNAVEVKAGNTLADAEDNKILTDADADSLPIPTDDYLVSQMPVLIGNAQFPYPPEAEKLNLEGTVVLSLLIDQNGIVKKAELVKGIHPILDEAATKFAMNLKFKPALQGSTPVAVLTNLSYRYLLKK